MSDTKKPLIVWSDPPPRKTSARSTKYEPIIQALKERPGQWACIQRNPNTKHMVQLANRLRTNKTAAAIARPYRLEVVARTTDEDAGVWARLVKETP